MTNQLKEYERNKHFDYNPKVRVLRSVRPKQIFSNVQMYTAGAQWKNDRHLMVTKNPNYHAQEIDYFVRDKRMLLKRREGTIMKNLALQQDLNHNNKKLEKELRKHIF